jgi:23S rRNA G2445 N2-methylase RlmL
VWRRGDFAELTPRDIAEIAAEVGGEGAPSTGLILANPPYGERMDEVDARLIYGELGDMCRRFRGWRAAFIVANREFEPIFASVVRAAPRVKKPLSNGPLRGYFYLWDL